MMGGSLETPINRANSTNATASTMYGALTASSGASTPPVSMVPKMATPRTSGPMVVPNELTPCAKLARYAPVPGSPSAMTYGLATICCNAKPNPMTNRAASISTKDCSVAAGTIPAAPTAEISNPRTSPFLYPILFRGSPALREITKYSNDPTKYAA